MAQQAQLLEKKISKTVRLDYLLHLPSGYDADTKKRWPLILFLHGMGERGSDVNLVKKHGLAKILDEKPDFPFVVLSPQCPLGTFWTHELDALNALLDEALKLYVVDKKRVYLTGLSMGGYGTWFLALSRPERFAAVAPICGGGDPDQACRLRDVPVWVFHGSKDTIVRPAESRLMVKALKNCGGNVRLTMYPGVGHDSWTQTYDNPELYTWFLQHRLP
jgi:predicted peptidase